MIRPLAVLFTLAVTTLPLMASAQTTWTEGKNYFQITPALHTSAPAGKIEVTEVFSYGCPHCSSSRPVVKQLKAALPPNAVFTLISSRSIRRKTGRCCNAYVTAEAQASRIVLTMEFSTPSGRAVNWRIDVQTNRIRTRRPPSKMPPGSTTS